MDVGVNFALNLINHNAVNIQGKFDPPPNARHLVGETNFNQYSPLLYGNMDGDWQEDHYHVNASLMMT